MSVLGIDLGTTNSVVAIADGSRATIVAEPEGSRTIPSVVAFLPGGEIVVGDVARDRRLLDAQNTIYAVKRLIGRPFQSPEVQRAKGRLPAFSLVEASDGAVKVEARGEQYSLPEISAFVLRECRSVAEGIVGYECTQAVITVPANFNQLQRSATRAAGRIAGLDVLRIINEPTAAAIAYGYGKASPAERVAVYDLGGGTFDVTVLALDGDVFQVEATGGDTFLGGEDVDVLLARFIAEQFLEEHNVDLRTDRQAFERIIAAAEFAKCVLSERTETVVRIPDIAPGPGGSHRSLEVSVTRSQLEAMIEPLLLRSLETCDRVLADAQLDAKDVDSVILVGGSTRIPKVRQIVSDRFGKEAHGEIDPDLVVALGASVQGFALTPKGANAPPRRRVKKSDTLARGKLKQRARSEVEGRLPAQPAFAPRRKGTDPMGAKAPPPLPVELTEELGEEPFFPELPAPEEAGPLDGDELFSGVVEDDPADKSRPFRLEIDDIAAAAAALDLEDAPLDHLPAPGHPSLFPDETTNPAPAPLEPAPELDLTGREAPLLMDVTAQSLGLETAGGFCERLIERNVPVPVEQTRFFSTAEDGQTEVEIRICQGESRDFADNQSLGRLVLPGLRQAKRGEVIIQVTFALDANGTLEVNATDTSTGSAQKLVVHQVGLMSDDEIAEVAKRQEAAWT